VGGAYNLSLGSSAVDDGGRLNVAGYSGTPLAKKLGLKAPMKLVTMGAPAEYPAWLGALPEGVAVDSEGESAGVLSARRPIVASARGSVQAAHVFTTKRAELAKRLGALRKSLEPAGFVWVSWPKKASKVATDITEDTIREIALPLGFVDIKVCAVTEVWSGLKLVIRKSER
jgi:hypothetical protein